MKLNQAWSGPGQACSISQTAENMESIDGKALHGFYGINGLTRC